MSGPCRIKEYFFFGLQGLNKGIRALGDNQFKELHRKTVLTSIEIKTEIPNSRCSIHIDVYLKGTWMNYLFLNHQLLAQHIS